MLASTLRQVIAAASGQVVASQVVGLGQGKEQDGGGDIFRLGNASQRYGLADSLFQPTTFQVTDAPDLRMVIYTPLAEENTAEKLAQLVEPMEIGSNIEE